MLKKNIDIVEYYLGIIKDKQYLTKLLRSEKEKERNTSFFLLEKTIHAEILLFEYLEEVICTCIDGVERYRAFSALKNIARRVYEGKDGFVKDICRDLFIFIAQKHLDANYRRESIEYIDPVDPQLLVDIARKESSLFVREQIAHVIDFEKYPQFVCEFILDLGLGHLNKVSDAIRPEHISCLIEKIDIEKWLSEKRYNVLKMIFQCLDMQDSQHLRFMLKVLEESFKKTKVCYSWKESPFYSCCGRLEQLKYSLTPHNNHEIFIEMSKHPDGEIRLLAAKGFVFANQGILMELVNDSNLRVAVTALEKLNVLCPQSLSILEKYGKALKNRDSIDWPLDLIRKSFEKLAEANLISNKELADIAVNGVCFSQRLLAIRKLPNESSSFDALWKIISGSGNFLLMIASLEVMEKYNYTIYPIAHQRYLKKIKRTLISSTTQNDLTRIKVLIWKLMGVDFE